MINKAQMSFLSSHPQLSPCEWVDSPAWMSIGQRISGAAIAKHPCGSDLGLQNVGHRLGAQTTEAYFPHSFGGWQLEIKVSVGLVSPEAPLLGSDSHLSLCPHQVFPLCMPDPNLIA